MPDVVDNPGQSRLEIVEETGIAVLEYRRLGTELALIHTGVPKDFEGQGYGGALVKAAIEKARDENLRSSRTAPTPGPGSRSTPRPSRASPSTRSTDARRGRPVASLRGVLAGTVDGSPSRAHSAWGAGSRSCEGPYGGCL